MSASSHHIASRQYNSSTQLHQSVDNLNFRFGHADIECFSAAEGPLVADSLLSRTPRDVGQIISEIMTYYTDITVFILGIYIDRKLHSFINQLISQFSIQPSKTISVECSVRRMKLRSRNRMRLTKNLQPQTCSRGIQMMLVIEGEVLHFHTALSRFLRS